MNEQYTTVSTTANILQSVLDAIYKLDRANIEVPMEPQEVLNDVQATIARLIGGVNA